MKERVFWTVLSVCLFNASLPGAPETLLLAKGGESFYTILVGPQPDKTEEFAAQELQNYLERITGVKSPIVTEVGESPFIAVGANSASESFDVPSRYMGDDSFHIHNVGKNLILKGAHPRSTLFAVYAFLEELGCRWFYPGEDIVPNRSREDVVETLQALAQAGKRKRYEPDFRIRMRRFLVQELGALGAPLEQTVMTRLPDEIDWMTKNRMNVLQFGLNHSWGSYSHWQAFRDAFPEMKKRGMVIGVGGHMLFMFMPEEKFSEHPEWLPFVDGKRQPKGQFCTSNTEAVQFYLQKLIEFLEQNPEIGYFAPWPKDTGGWCECEKCHGTPLGDRYMDLGKQIYSTIKSRCPGVEVTHFAYGSHLGVPQQNRPIQGMSITLCLWGRDLSIPIENEKTHPGYRENLKQWLDIAQSTHSSCVLHEKYARHLGLGLHMMPVPILATDIKYLKANGIDGLELPMAYMGRWSKGLNLYLIAQLMWNANANVDTIVDDFFRQYYGSLSGTMREAFEIIESGHQDWRYWMNNYAREGLNVPLPGVFPAEILTHAQQIIRGVEKEKKLRAYREQLLDRVETEQGAKVAQIIRSRVDRFVTCVDYWSFEWGGLIALAKGAGLLEEMNSADTKERWQDLLKEAKREFLDAQAMNEERLSLAAQTDKVAMYWNVTAARSWGVFSDDQLEKLLKYLSEIEANGWQSR